MARIVMKFGGTSVADVERIKNVAKRVKREVEDGNEVAVVVSAMSGTTNQLVKWVNDIAPLHDPREYDVVVATGEQVTIGLLALALQQEGVKSRSWVSWQIPIKTDDAFAKARILEIDTTAMGKTMEQGEVPIVPGFQGVAPDGRITTLGRGGSDTSAVALAAGFYYGWVQLARQIEASAPIPRDPAFDDSADAWAWPAFTSTGLRKLIWLALLLLLLLLLILIRPQPRRKRRDYEQN